MRHPSPSRGSPTSWMGHKNQAAAFYKQGDYESALTSYTAALSPEYGCPNSEKLYLLSNLVACRLQMGGAAQARAAVENAKQCIEINPRWAKGHVRLASAYLALGLSNDACNALQRALSLDPGNQVARDMLVRELRRDSADSGAGFTSPMPSAPPEDEDDSRYSAQQQHDQASSSSSTNPSYQDYDDSRPPRDYSEQQNEPRDFQYEDVPSVSLWERVQTLASQCITWYNAQSNDTKALLRIALLMVFLYVAFGGRFGLFGTGSGHRRGNYDVGNAYDRFHDNSLYEPRYRNHGRHRDHHQHDRRRTSYWSSYDDDDERFYRRSHQSSYGFSSLFGGIGLFPLLVLLGVASVATRFGIRIDGRWFNRRMFGGPFGMHGFGMRHFAPRQHRQRRHVHDRRRHYWR